MQGTVSLAVALALPSTTTRSGGAFPRRTLIMSLTLAVIFVTFAGKGLALPASIPVWSRSSLVSSRRDRRRAIDSCVVLVEEAVLKGVREAVASADQALLPLRSVARNARDGLSDVISEIKQAAGITLVGKAAKSGRDGVVHVVNEFLEGFECLAPGLFFLVV